MIFFLRYHAVLEALAGLVHMRVRVGKPFITHDDAAQWISRNLPTLYKRTFGSSDVKALKIWRLKTMMSNAAYLGAYEEYDIKSVRGRGLTTVVKPRLRRVKEAA